MEKYGFVYLWYDHKHKRYYIGCRWGREDDGYICSSPWMKRGYKLRPHDFKRRILKRIYTNKKDLLEEEYRWLSMIKQEELGKKYYNLHNHHFGHWSTDKERREEVSKKMSRPMSKETKQKLRELTKKQFSNPEERLKQSERTKSMWLDQDYRAKNIQTKTGKPLGPRNGKEYCDAWKKELGMIAKCRKGKGGKTKSVIVEGIRFRSISEAAASVGVHHYTITQWIRRGKAQLI